ncbi:inositol monophosphatase [Modestobacter sp. I12A-02628]|uniref:Inositol-1-monophosphatase n=1 Tax=Goekera deserti TaxID=2497753 RepID=A0A7K3WDW3_9ACTN|nr:inositol monophosphatase [Goekera deserti]NDI46948.1 inositol monophosphatase [Goekera deserti]NEL54516.1 inositol monophosphatase [Goekera deserti]
MADPLVDELLALARATAAEAAGLVAAGRATAADDVQPKSSPVDVVTAVDRACEELVVRRLLAARPDDGVLGEEGAAREARAPRAGDGTGRVRWVVDPIDGTVNFLYGVPAYAVCIAAELDGVAVAGVVHNAATGEVFSAARGRGAWREAPGAAPSRLTGRAPTTLDLALVGTGFGYAAGLRRREGAIVADLLPLVRDVRRYGSAALEMCEVAAGRLDAFYELDLHRWDHAAAAVVVREAGMVVTGLPGRPVGEPMVVAAGPTLAGPLVELLDRLCAEHP